MERENCWVWFKGSINNKGVWKGGFVGTKDEKIGILIESPSYVQCRVPEWRVLAKEPIDLYAPPVIPEGAQWKII